MVVRPKKPLNRDAGHAETLGILDEYQRRGRGRTEAVACRPKRRHKESERQAISALELQGAACRRAAGRRGVDGALDQLLEARRHRGRGCHQPAIPRPYRGAVTEDPLRLAA